MTEATEDGAAARVLKFAPIEQLLDGVPIQLNGVTYTLPPCSLATLKRHAKGIEAFAKMGEDFVPSLDAIETITSVVTEALRRNYPGITEDFVAESLGIDKIMDTFQAAMDVSGLIRKAAQGTETAPDMPAQEGGTLGESTGIESSPTS